MSIPSPTPSTPVYTDIGGLAALRSRAEQNPNATLAEVAKHLESMFLQMMLSSMRDASLADGIFDSDQMKTYRDLYDRQLGLELASHQGLGLATVLLRQLGGDPEAAADATVRAETVKRAEAIPSGLPPAAPQAAVGPVLPATTTPARADAPTTAADIDFANAGILATREALTALADGAVPVGTTPPGMSAPIAPAALSAASAARTDAGPSARPVVPRTVESVVAALAARPTPAEPARSTSATPAAPVRAFSSPKDFIEQLWPHAQAAGKAIGAPPGALIAQAALETGWGRSIPGNGEGGSSHNLFGIKADSRWTGPRALHQTTEVRDGVFVREPHRFRVYESFEESFSDFARFLKENPRYTEALRHTANPDRFFTELQRAGYATDPGYAAKLTRVYGRVDATGAG